MVWIFVFGLIIVTDFRTNVKHKYGKKVLIFMYARYAKLRDDHNLSDYRVSADTGITKSTFSDWKSGRSSPKIEKLMILADYFKVPLEYFVRG